MLSKPIFETLPMAVSLLLMLLVHSLPAFIVGGILIVTSCIMLYRRLTEMGTDPDVMDYIDTANHRI